MARKNNRAAVYIEAEDKTRAGVESAKRNLGVLDESVIGLRSSLAGLAAGLTGGTFIAFVANTSRAVDEVGKLGQAVGMSTEELSAYRYAARMSDVSNEQLSTGLRQLAKNVADTAAGTGEARAAFAALGISVTDNTGKLRNADDMMRELADRFAGMEDGAGKTALAMKIFGESGAALIPMLNQGSGGLADMRAEAERLGLILSSDAVEAAERFNDEITKLGARAEGLSITLANQVLPTLNEWIEEMDEGWRRMERLQDIHLIWPMKLNPFKDWEDHARDLHKEIEELEGALARLPAAGGGSAVTARRNSLQQQLRDRRLQLGFVYDQMDATDGSSVVPGFQIPGGKSAAPNMRNLAAEEAARRKALQERYQIAKQLQAAEEQWAQDYADAWKFASESVNNDLEAVVQQEIDRMQGWYAMIDAEQERAIEEGQALLDAFAANERAIKSMDTAGKELGLTLSSALGEVITQGGNAREVMQGLLKDIAQMVLKRAVLKPLEGAIGGFLDDILPFADGGIMTSNGPVPLRRYASGGIANSPQLALFGEGSTPEAYVPLPDGRRIPVAMEGGGGGGGSFTYAPQYTIDARGADETMLPRLERMLNERDARLRRELPALVADRQARGQIRFS